MQQQRSDDAFLRPRHPMRCLGRHKYRGRWITGVSGPVRWPDGGGGRLQGGVARGSRVGATDGQGGGTPGLLVRRRVASGRSRVRGRGTRTRRRGCGTLATHWVRASPCSADEWARFGRFASPATVGSSPPPNRRISSTCMTSSRDSPSRKPWITWRRSGGVAFSPDFGGALRGGGGSDVRVGARVPANETRKRRGGGVSWRARRLVQDEGARCPTSRTMRYTTRHVHHARVDFTYYTWLKKTTRAASPYPAQGQEVNWNTLPTISRPVGICQVKRAVFTTLSAM